MDRVERISVGSAGKVEEAAIASVRRWRRNSSDTGTCTGAGGSEATICFESGHHYAWSDGRVPGMPIGDSNWENDPRHGAHGGMSEKDRRATVERRGRTAKVRGISPENSRSGLSSSGGGCRGPSSRSCGSPSSGGWQKSSKEASAARAGSSSGCRDAASSSSFSPSGFSRGCSIGGSRRDAGPRKQEESSRGRT